MYTNIVKSSKSETYLCGLGMCSFKDLIDANNGVIKVCAGVIKLDALKYTYVLAYLLC